MSRFTLEQQNLLCRAFPPCRRADDALQVGFYYNMGGTLFYSLTQDAFTAEERTFLLGVMQEMPPKSSRPPISPGDGRDSRMVSGEIHLPEEVIHIHFPAEFLNNVENHLEKIGVYSVAGLELVRKGDGPRFYRTKPTWEDGSPVNQQTIDNLYDMVCRYGQGSSGMVTVEQSGSEPYGFYLKAARRDVALGLSEALSNIQRGLPMPAPVEQRALESPSARAFANAAPRPDVLAQAIHYIGSRFSVPPDMVQAIATVAHMQTLETPLPKGNVYILQNGLVQMVRDNKIDKDLARALTDYFDNGGKISQELMRQKQGQVRGDRLFWQNVQAVLQSGRGVAPQYVNAPTPRG